ncbi:MAG: aconitate hydratase AcnA, partial [Chlamydiia bacterium]|nr:aconitate hydratase AcnA [Chlamydiia bacterium]
IEAEAAMLGQPIALLIPDVIGVYLHGDLKEGVTATDLTLRITEMLRKENVVGKFVEFFGPGVAALSVADRATIANMAPEYGATMGFFPVDERTLEYLLLTGRSREQVDLVRAYLTEQELFGLKERGEIDFTKELTLNLNSVSPSVAGPKRPQDRIDLPKLKEKFIEQLRLPVDKGGYGKAEELDKKPPKICVHTGGAFNLNYEHETGGMSALDPDKEDLSWSEEEMVTNRPLTEAIAHPGYLEGTTCDIVLRHGSVAIAAITSCTNTSNPHVMLAAGLVAKKAVEAGLKVNPMVKTSLAPGSRVVTDYLQKSGLQHYLDELGFNLVAYGCTTCIGNSGPLEERIEMAVKDHDLVVASVLSGNRNFEARVNSAVKANFLMSPPLVVAFALAGCVDIDLEKEPLGYGSDGKGVFLKDIWPTNAEIEETLKSCLKPEMFIERYSKVFEGTSHWENIPTVESAQYAWDPDSTYIQKPPYFDDFTPSPHFSGHFSQMRPLALFGDSVTTDHISPAGAFRSTTSAGKYLISLGVNEGDFNSYGSRRGNHQVMMRGTFANVRIRNFMAEGKEGGYTKLLPSGEIVSIFDACEHYMEEKVPLIVFAGKDYGMGSSRDWAAKGPALLGVVAVVASSFERIHRSNLIGMGVLPLEFTEGVTHESLGIRGDELFTLKGIEQGLRPGQEVVLEISRGNKVQTTPLNVRLDTPAEVDYFLNGGILPYVVRQLLKQH